MLGPSTVRVLLPLWVIQGLKSHVQQSKGRRGEARQRGEPRQRGQGLEREAQVESSTSSSFHGTLLETSADPAPMTSEGQLAEGGSPSLGRL